MLQYIINILLFCDNAPYHIYSFQDEILSYTSIYNRNQFEFSVDGLLEDRFENLFETLEGSLTTSLNFFFGLSNVINLIRIVIAYNLL